MKRFILLFLSLLLGGCQLSVPSLSPLAPLDVRSYAGGLLYRFTLQPGQTGNLAFSSSNRLALVIGGGAPATPYLFRVQDNPGLAGQEAGFTESSRFLKARPAPSFKVQSAGNVEEFWINTGNSNPDGSGDLKRTTHRRFTGQHAYYYVDSQATVSDDNLQKLSQAFEQTIYPTITREFGSEPKPGIDKDDRLFVVISPAVDNFGKEKGLLGYFWSRDALPGQVNGNNKEVIFLTDNLFTHPTVTAFGTLAHEFTHLVVFNQKTLGHQVSEDTWLNEGFAMLGMDLCGYGLSGGNEDVARDINSYLSRPQAYSLTDWAGNPRGFSYGLSYLFCRFLFDQNPAALREAVKSDLAGIPCLEKILAARGSDFSSFFADWITANYLSGLRLPTEPRFAYSSGVDLRRRYGTVQLDGILPQRSTSSVFNGNLRPWSAAYYLFENRRDWRFELKANQGGLYGGAIRLE
ncbi:MAG TPA: hypothetical protein DD435_03445 [Cyanobacteria bacterium UBA8530]|nr:hypothetical protein [Cyanobacteria bacterium UBA8530]